MFWKPNSDWEVALGLRYDRENRVSRSAISGAILPIAKLKSSEWQPKLTVSRKWTPDLMTYVSVARGYRGGGFNASTPPTRNYSGEQAWPYEEGANNATPGLKASGEVSDKVVKN